MAERNQILEEVAQMLYDRAQIASDSEDNAITQEMKYMYSVQSLTYCGAAEEVRRMMETENA